jgi:methyl-accepting chemotaxis protein
MIAMPATGSARGASPKLYVATGWGLLAAAPSMLAAVLDGGIAWAFALAGAIATVVAMTMYARSVSSRIQDLSSALERASRGELTQQQVASPHDVIGDAIRSADAFTAMVSQIVAQVKSEAVVIAFEGNAFLQRSQDLSARTEQQAAALQETAASVQQLSASVSRNVGSVQRMREMVDSVQHAAQEAQTAMTEAVGSMEGIDQSSRRTATAVAVIDEIAFQTNILALNAAVEAARAGAAGKGFGVVAAEVRGLAQRCASAAAEIGTMMQASTADVSSGTRIIRATSDHLLKIGESVQALSLEAQAVMVVTKDQSCTLDQISEAVRHIDSAVQQNALMVDVISRSAGLLTEKAQRVSKSVANIRLRQGTADEARAMLDRAMQHIDAVGQHQAFEDFHRSDAGFIDRDLYIVVTDRAGNYKVFGSRPDFVGKNIASVPGIDAEQFLRDAIQRADEGGGWVEYQVIHPSSNTVQDKISCFTQLGPDLLIGCGVFKSVMPTAKA